VQELLRVLLRSVHGSAFLGVEATAYRAEFLNGREFVMRLRCFFVNKSLDNLEIFDRREVPARCDGGHSIALT
jgi:hypothetical protein